MKKLCTVVHHNKDDYDVFIGRPNKWSSPFKVGEDGTREEVLAKFEDYLINSKELMGSLPELEGKVLGCWCKPLPCHGDIIAKYVNAGIEEHNLILLLK